MIMKNFLRYITYTILIICIFMLSLCGCNTQKQENSGKLKIVATLFAQYDFARRIAGDKADVELLLSPGVEVHTYDPTPQDMIKIKNSDLFIYTGKYMESWAEKTVDGLEPSAAVDVSEGIELSQLDSDEDEAEHKDDENHVHTLDPHIWTSPANAIIMVKNIENALIRIDRANEQIYKNNAEEYISELQELDNDFMTFASSVKNKKIIFGGRFAMHYFCQRYGFEWMSAYDSCSSEFEPSAKKVAEIIDTIQKENIKAIYYEEMSNHALSDQISSQTGAQTLLLHTCHNVSKDELSAGETYISLMRKNLENLKKGMN